MLTISLRCHKTNPQEYSQNGITLKGVSSITTTTNDTRNAKAFVLFLKYFKYSAAAAAAEDALQQIVLSK